MTTSDDPFGSPEFGPTFVIPSPGQRSAAQAAPHAGASADASVALEALMPSKGINRIVAAASLLLNAVLPLRATAQHSDPDALRERLADGIRAFETASRAAGVEERNVTAGRYILCTFLDETAAHTPWGGGGAWSRHSLLVMFQQEAWGGEKVFQLLAKLIENPTANRELLELLHVVLALGFEGRYRMVDNGRSELARVRERLYSVLRMQRGDFELELSPHWKGVEAKRTVLAAWPLWAVFAVAGLLAFGFYMAASIRLNAWSDPVFNQIQALRPLRTAVPEPVAPAPAPRPRLATFLEPEIQAGLVAVADFDDRSVITIRGDGLFPPGSAEVSARVRPLMARIAEALASVAGSVLITGHTDSQPIRSARFPSNWHLSEARARSVQALIAQTLPQDRMRAEGRADAEPVAGNDTAADRARNRRVEITLFVRGGS